MGIMYVGMFYMTNGQYHYIEDVDSIFHWLFLPLVFFPSVLFLLLWLKTIVINCLAIAYQNNIKVFRILTLNLWNQDDFYKNHIEQEPEIAPTDDDGSHFHGDKAKQADASTAKETPQQPIHDRLRATVVRFDFDADFLGVADRVLEKIKSLQMLQEKQAA